MAKVSRHLEEIAGTDGKKLYDPETVALFLMRCLFTMFAEDVELLPKNSFREISKRCKDNPSLFPRLVEQLWAAMDKGGFAYAIERDVKEFNGYLFKNRTVLPLPCQEIGELYEAATKDWKLVEPAIFGALLEQALDPAERKKLGAHYTPRVYVEAAGHRGRSGTAQGRMGRMSRQRRRPNAARATLRAQPRWCKLFTQNFATSAFSIRPAAPAIFFMCRSNR